MTKERVLLLQQRQWGLSIGHELAKRLQDAGYRLSAFTSKKTTHDFTCRQKEVSYELILSHDEIKEVHSETGVTLEEICADLGEETIWPFVYTMRNAVYSYKDKYYYSFRQNLSDDQIVSYLKTVYISIRSAFEKFTPDIVIMPNAVSLFQNLVVLMARRRGAKVILFADSKIFGVYMIFRSRYLDSGPFIDRIAELNGGVVSQNWERAKVYIEEFREKFKRSANSRLSFDGPSGLAWARQELQPYKRAFRFFRGGGRDNKVSSFGITTDYRPPRIILRDHYASKRYQRAALSRRYPELASLGKFVYFPLQVQPEETIDMLATRFANQIETARQIALSLPGDYTLAVKEHPSMINCRPPSYHEKIDRLPNVKLLDPRTPTFDILERCGLVISVGGTTVAEAAFFNRAAIQLGHVGTTKQLPNVTLHHDMTTLPQAISRVLARTDLNSKEYEYKLQNYVAAAYDSGIEVDFSRVWYHGGTPDEYDAIYERVLSALC